MNARHDLEMSSSMIAAAMIVSACSTHSEPFHASSLLDSTSFQLVVDGLLEEALLAPCAPDNHAVVVASAQLFRTLFRVSPLMRGFSMMYRASGMSSCVTLNSSLHTKEGSSEGCAWELFVRSYAPNKLACTPCAAIACRPFCTRGCESRPAGVSRGRRCTSSKVLPVAPIGGCQASRLGSSFPKA